MIQLLITDVVKAVNGTLIRPELIKSNSINGVSIDSRKIEKNQIYIPIIGEKYDGHDFIEIVFEKGISVVITEKEDKIPQSFGGILVKDTKKSLIDLAKYYRSLFDIPVIAITGSVGKTSCKEMIASILSAKYKVHKTKGNYNNDIGLPLTILDMPCDTEVAIFEMGMNHFGEIDLLSSIALPNIAVITNIGVSHIEFLGSRDGILKAKSEIINHLDKDGILLLNGDDEYLRKLFYLVNQEIITYGFNKDNIANVIEYEELGFDGLKASLKTNKDLYDLKVNILGKHMLYHVLTGIVIGEKLNMTKNEIIQGINTYRTEKMRLNMVKLENDILIINDTYNASVDSMKSSLDLLKSFNTSGRKVAILGDMFELGFYAKEAHEQVGEYAANSKIELLICVGKSSKWMYKKAIQTNSDDITVVYFENKEELIVELPNLLMIKDTILLKASRGMKLEDAIDKIKEVDFK